MNKESVVIAGLIAVAVVMAPTLVYFASTSIVANAPALTVTTTTTFSTSSPTHPVNNSTFVLNLVEIMDVNYNSTVGAQARYYVVSANGLESSANITIPSHRLIELVITSYDMGNATPPAQYDKVTGTIGNQISVINGMVASGDNVSQEWEQNYTTVPAGLILHTFTVPQLGLNIPVIAGDTEMAYFYANSTGTFTWMCMTPCGYGADGLSGAMDTPGWMTGSITVT